MTKDSEKLREKIMDEAEAAMFNGFPQAVVDLSDAENADEDELREIAKKMHLEED